MGMGSGSFEVQYNPAGWSERPLSSIDGSEFVGIYVEGENESYQRVTISNLSTNAGNGLTKNGNSLDLGGTLTDPVTLSGDTSFAINLTDSTGFTNTLEISLEDPTSPAKGSLFMDNPGEFLLLSYGSISGNQKSVFEASQSASAIYYVSSTNVLNNVTASTSGVTVNTNGGNIALTSAADISLTATGDISISGLIYPSSDGTSGQAIFTDGSGTLSFSGVAASQGNQYVINVSDGSGGLEDSGWLLNNRTFSVDTGGDGIIGSSVGNLTIQNTHSTSDLKLEYLNGNNQGTVTLNNSEADFRYYNNSTDERAFLNFNTPNALVGELRVGIDGEDESWFSVNSTGVSLNRSNGSNTNSIAFSNSAITLTDALGSVGMLYASDSYTSTSGGWIPHKTYVDGLSYLSASAGLSLSSGELKMGGTTDESIAINDTATSTFSLTMNGGISMQAISSGTLSIGNFGTGNMIIQRSGSGDMQFTNNGSGQLFIRNTAGSDLTIQNDNGTFNLANNSGDAFTISSFSSDLILDAGSNNLQLSGFGSGTNSGTSTYHLAVDSSGNIIETSVGGVSVDNQDDNRIVTATSTSGTLNAEATFLYDGAGNMSISTGTFRGINSGTSDGSDNATFYISGGGAVGSIRGAQILLHGNEVTTTGGDLELYGGNGGVSGNIVFKTGSGSPTQATIDTTGSLQLSQYGSGSCTGTLTNFLAVDSSGNVIETTFNETGLDTSSTVLDSYTFIVGSTFGSAVHRFNSVPLFSILFANGAEGSESFAVLNENIGRVDSRPWAGTDYATNSGAYMQFVANETQSSGSLGTRIEFATVADGSSSASLAMTIEADGSLSLESNDILNANSINANSLNIEAISEPSSPSSGAIIFVDSGDNDLKVKFSNGTVQTLAMD